MDRYTRMAQYRAERTDDWVVHLFAGAAHVPVPPTAVA